MRLLRAICLAERRKVAKSASVHELKGELRQLWVRLSLNRGIDRGEFADKQVDRYAIRHDVICLQQQNVFVGADAKKLRADQRWRREIERAPYEVADRLIKAVTRRGVR